jgi:hypothetical protein
MDLSSYRRSLMLGIVGLLAVALAGFAVPSVQARDAKAAGQVATLRAGLWRPSDGSVKAIAFDKKRIYIGGDFTTLTGPMGETVSRSGIAALNRTTGALIKRFHPRINGAVTSLAIHRKLLYVGGSFTQVKGLSRNYLVAIKAPSNKVVKKGWRLQLDAPVRALLHMGKRLYVGGEFHEVAGKKRRSLFAIKKAPRAIKSWPKIPRATNGAVNALAAGRKGTAVIVGGRFHELVGKNRVNLGAVTVKKGRATAWKPRPGCATDCPVRDIAVRKGLVFAGIDGPGGRVRAYRWSNGSTKWNVGLNGEVDAVAVSRTSLLLGGHFTQVAGQSRPMVAVLDVASGALSAKTFTTTPPNFPGVLEIKVKGKVALLGGTFTEIQGQANLSLIKRP